MKSDEKELKRRGLITNESLAYFKKLKTEEIIPHLQSKDASHRSSAYRVLFLRGFFNDNNNDDILAAALFNEKALYTRLEITNILENGNETTASKIIKFLGEIGKNQHTIVPSEISKKESFPLPRDLIARTLGNMKVNILPVLTEAITTTTQKQLNELIDAIGYFVSKNLQYATEEILAELSSKITPFLKYELILWKWIILLQSFNTPTSIALLKQYAKSRIPIMKLEAERSLLIIAKSKQEKAKATAVKKAAPKVVSKQPAKTTPVAKPKTKSPKIVLEDDKMLKKPNTKKK